MPIPYAAKLRAIQEALSRAPVAPAIVVETGSYRGQMAIRLPALFAEVHTIELSETLFAQHPAHARVVWHLGCSRQHVARLAQHCRGPVLWFLDAHYFSGRGAAGAGDFPLWEELRILSSRAQPDIVIVDDVHTFGRCRPARYGDWHNVTEASIRAALWTCDNPVMSSVTAADMHIICRRGPVTAPT